MAGFSTPRTSEILWSSYIGQPWIGRVLASPHGHRMDTRREGQNTGYAGSPINVF